VRRALGLAPPPRRSAVLAAVAIVALAALVGLAAAQPVALGSEPRLVRTDAEAYFVFDITRSMLASAGPDEPDRLQRARELAREIRGAVPDVPAGIASFTNRLVPHVFPTVDRALFESGLDRSLAIERPAPDRGEGALLTAFDALAPLQTHNFFSPDATRRVAIVLTDGESQPVSQETLRALRADPPLELLLVRVWAEDERIHRPRIPFDARYGPDPASAATLTAFAGAVAGRTTRARWVSSCAGCSARASPSSWARRSRRSRSPRGCWHSASSHSATCWFGGTSSRLGACPAGSPMR
jgi:hypothetical protein